MGSSQTTTLRSLLEVVKKVKKESEKETLPTLRERIDELNGRLQKLAGTHGINKIQKIYCFVPQIEIKDQLLYDYLSPELVNITLGIIEDQIAFIERTAEQTVAKVQDDIKENEKISIQNRINQYRTETEPIIKEINKLEQKIPFYKEKAQALQEIERDISELLQESERTYSGSIHTVEEVRWPKMPLGRPARYRADIELALNKFRGIFAKIIAGHEAMRASLKIVIDPTSSFAPSKDHQGTEVVLPDVPIEQMKTEVEDTAKKRDVLFEKLRPLEEAVKQAEMEINAKLKLLSDWVTIIKQLNALLENVNPNTDIKNLVSEKLTKIKADAKHLQLV